MDPHPGYVFGASFISPQGEYQLLVFKDPGFRQAFLQARMNTAVKFLDLPGGAFNVAEADKS